MRHAIIPSAAKAEKTTQQLVSIITVTYNSAVTIRETIESVLEQSYDNIQHIFIDGQSTDNTVEVIEQYRNRYDIPICLISEPDEGLYDAMNKGVKLATGDIIGILNSDDILAHSGVISSVINTLKLPDIDACYGDIEFFETDHPDKTVRKWVASMGNYRFGWNPPHPSLYVRKRVYQLIGGYRADLRLASDYDFMVRAFWRGNCRATYVPDTWVRMRLGGKSTQGIHSNIAAFREVQQCLRANDVMLPIMTNSLRLLRKTRQLVGGCAAAQRSPKILSIAEKGMKN